MIDPDAAKAAVHRFYDAEAGYMLSATRDFAPVAETLSENVLLCEPASLPYGGEYRGRTGFERWLRAFADSWSSIEVRDVELFAVDEIIFSRSHVYAKARATGAPADWPLLQYFRLDGGRVAELRPFHWDTAAMLPALKQDGSRL